MVENPQFVKYWIRPNKKENYNPQDRKLWNTRGVNQMGMGDKIIFYISGKKYMKFASIASIKGEDPEDGSLICEYEIQLPEEKWVDRPPKEFLSELDVVKNNFNLDKGGLGLLVKTTRQITRNDFLKIEEYIMNKSKKIKACLSFRK